MVKSAAKTVAAPPREEHPEVEGHASSMIRMGNKLLVGGNGFAFPDSNYPQGGALYDLIHRRWMPLGSEGESWDFGEATAFTLPDDRNQLYLIASTKGMHQVNEDGWTRPLGMGRNIWLRSPQPCGKSLFLFREGLPQRWVFNKDQFGLKTHVFPWGKDMDFFGGPIHYELVVAKSSRGQTLYALSGRAFGLLRCDAEGTWTQILDFQQAFGSPYVGHVWTAPRGLFVSPQGRSSEGVILFHVDLTMAPPRITSLTVAEDGGTVTTVLVTKHYVFVGVQHNDGSGAVFTSPTSLRRWRRMMSFENEVPQAFCPGEGILYIASSKEEGPRWTTRIDAVEIHLG